MVQLLIVPATENEAVVHGLKQSSTYEFRVVSGNSDGGSRESNILQATTMKDGEEEPEVDVIEDFTFDAYYGYPGDVPEPVDAPQTEVTTNRKNRKKTRRNTVV